MDLFEKAQEDPRFGCEVPAKREEWFDLEYSKKGSQAVPAGQLQVRREREREGERVRESKGE